MALRSQYCDVVGKFWTPTQQKDARMNDAEAFCSLMTDDGVAIMQKPDIFTVTSFLLLFFTSCIILFTDD